MLPESVSLTGSITGLISVHPKGFGFVSDEARDLSAFMPPPLLNRFLQDDVVEALFEQTGPDKRTVKDARLVRRPRRTLTGRVLTRAGKRFLKVDRAVANTDWPLEGADGLAKDGDYVVAAIAGDTRCVRAPTPCRPTKLRLLVEAQRSPAGT